MRLSATAALLGAVLAGTSPANAAWHGYISHPLGFAFAAPGELKVEKGTYRGAVAGERATLVYRFFEDNIDYRAVVIDMTDIANDSASLLGEAESMVRQLGDVTSVSASRVEPGRAAVFGRFITIVCRSAHVPDLLGQTAESVRAWFKNITGAECVDGSRLMANMFFHRGRLYIIQGMNLPTEDTASPAALRFANSISFFAADGSRNFADTFK